MSLEVSIIVPDRIFWKNNAKEIILPTLTGQMGVLKDHIPLLTGLDTGLMLVRSVVDTRWTVIAVMGGFALVNNNKVTILVNEAELGSEIDPQEAESNFLAAKLALEGVSDSKKKLENTLQFKKARTRFL
uniref:ATP synthase CF0 subunit epsilon n=1 Tax=Flexiglena variabilis TaxID=2743688 RepID=UPI0023AA7BFB|nr:ATP synthase CF0 subunit epsilon [Flexiglena variabilis]WCH63494.1 ATP synthase CF0 subunit epsilon [Flexiglena variabilis]